MRSQSIRQLPTSGSRAALFLLAASLACCALEGAARKWVLGGDTSIASRLAYLSKDIVMLCFLLLGAGRPNRLTRMAKPLLALGVGLLAVGAICTAGLGVQPVGAVLTIRTFFVLPIAAWAAGRLLPPDALRKFALWIALLSLPMAALATLQFFSSSRSAINRYSTMEAEAHATTSFVSDRVRATGTFSYITGLSEFSILAAWAGIFTFTSARTRAVRWLGYSGLVAGGCCALTTVSRAPVLVIMGLVAVWAFAGGKFGRKLQMAVAMGIAGLAAVSLSGAWGSAGEVIGTVYRRNEIAGDGIGSRFWYQFILPLSAVSESPLGEGLGSQQASVTNGQVGRRGLEGTYESAIGRTILELGLIGFAGFLATCAAVFRPAWFAYRTAPKGEPRTAMAVTGAALAARALIGFQFNHVASYFFWSMAAALWAWSAAAPRRRGPMPLLAGRLNSRRPLPTQRRADADDGRPRPNVRLP
jgi:hypothetical protein